MASGGINILSCKASRYYTLLATNTEGISFFLIYIIKQWDNMTWKDDHNPFISAMITTVLLLLGGELQRILGVWVANQRVPLTLPMVLVKLC